MSDPALRARTGPAVDDSSPLEPDQAGSPGPPSPSRPATDFKSGEEMERSIFKFVKSIWRKYDKAEKGEIDYEEAKVFFNEVCAPLLNRKLPKAEEEPTSPDPEGRKSPAVKVELFTEAECQEMFADIDKDGGGTVDRTEMALYIMKLIKNKNQKAAKSDYLIKLNELKKFIDSKV